MKSQIRGGAAMQSSTSHSDTLLRLSGEVETAFVGTGQSIMTSTNQLTALLQDLKAITESDEEVAARTRAALSSASGEAAEASVGIAALQRSAVQAKGIIDAIGESVAAVSSRYRMLSSMRLLTLIYSVEMHSAHEDLHHFGTQMAEQTERATRIVTGMRSTVERFTDAIALSTASDRPPEAQRAELEALSAGLDETSERLRRVTEDGAHSMSGVERCNDQLAQEVSRCVTTLQFADAFRQRIEHVVEALKRLECLIATGQLAEAEANAPLNEAEAKEAEEALRRVVASQLAAAAGDLRQEQTALAQALRSMIDGIAGLNQDVVAAATDPRRMSERAALLLALQEASGRLSDFAEFTGGQIAAHAEIITALSALLEQVEELDRFRAAMMFSATNALILARRVEGQGRAFGVVAAEIMAIARENATVIVALGDQFRTLAGALTTGAGGDTDISGRLGQTALTVREGTVAIDKAEMARAGNVAAYRQALDAVRKDLVSAASAISRIEAVPEALLDVSAAVRQGLSESATTVISEKVAELLGRSYTTAAEREVQIRAIGGAVGDVVASDDEGAEEEEDLLAEVLF